MAVVIFKPDFIGYCYVKKVVGHPLTITMGSWLEWWQTTWQWSEFQL